MATAVIHPTTLGPRLGPDDDRDRVRFALDCDSRTHRASQAYEARWAALRGTGSELWSRRLIALASQGTIARLEESAGAVALSESRMLEPVISTTKVVRRGDHLVEARPQTPHGQHHRDRPYHRHDENDPSPRHETTVPTGPEHAIRNLLADLEAAFDRMEAS